MMSPASSNPVMTDDAAAKGWSTIMRLYTRDDQQGEFIGPWIARKYAGKNLVILHDKAPTARASPTRSRRRPTRTASMKFSTRASTPARRIIPRW